MQSIIKHFMQPKGCKHVSTKDWDLIMKNIKNSTNCESILLIDGFNARPLYVPSHDFCHDFPYNELSTIPPFFCDQKKYMNWFWDQIQPKTFYLRIHVCNVMELMNKVVFKFRSNLHQINCHFFILNKDCIEFLVKNCPNLEAINFENTIGIHLDSCRLFAKLVNLKYLNLSGCDIYESGLEVILKQCKHLKSLNISNNCEIKGRCLVWVNASIERLDLRDCWRLESKELIAMTRLRLEALTELLVNSGINDETIAEICDNCPNIRHLNISFECLAYSDHCGRRVLSDSGFCEMAKLDKLEILTLRHVGKLTDTSLQCILKGCKNISQLTLNLRHRHQLTDDAFTDIAILCPNLQYLESVHNHFIGKHSLNSICKMDSVVALVLRGNELVDNDITPAISECKNLRFLDLDGCNVNELVLEACIERAKRLQPKLQIFNASLIRTNIDRNVLSEKVLPKNLRVRVSGRNNFEHFSEFNGKKVLIGLIEWILPYYWLDFC